jgi:hypothetical protein
MLRAAILTRPAFHLALSHLARRLFFRCYNKRESKADRGSGGSCEGRKAPPRFL